MLTLWLAYKAWKERCASEPYVTGYEPIKDSSGAQIGIYYVGYWFCWMYQR